MFDFTATLDENIVAINDALCTKRAKLAQLSSEVYALEDVVTVLQQTKAQFADIEQRYPSVAVGVPTKTTNY